MVKTASSSFRFGHIPTRAVSSFMSRLLFNEEKYTEGERVEVPFGKPWQLTSFENNRTGNSFWGEPMIEGDRESVYTFTYKDIDWGISFHFSGRRSNRKGIITPHGHYGSNIGMDRLYYILVNKLNGGVDFVSVFLRQIAPILLGTELIDLVDPVIDDIAEEAGLIDSFETVRDSIDRSKMLNTRAFRDARYSKYNRKDRRYRAVREVEAKLSQKKGIRGWATKSQEASKTLKEAFVRAMSSGSVPLLHANKEKTKKIKEKLYGMDLPTFVASEQFINSIVFDLSLRLH